MANDFHVPRRRAILRTGAGSAEGGGHPPPVNATGGIAGPLARGCGLCDGRRDQQRGEQARCEQGRLRFRVRMASPCSGSEPEYHVELRRPRRLLVVLNQVEVRVV
jgi:hypothetical protein